MTVPPDDSAEFSRKLRLDRLASGRYEQQLEAGAQERSALATRFGLQELTSLTGQVLVTRPMDSPLVRVEGSLAADVVQTCVVSLQPFAARVEESFVQLFTLDDSSADDGEVFVAADEDDTPEPLTVDSLDLGEVLAEQLALALDPHPRAPGVSFEGASFGATGPEDGDDAPDNPFAVLRQLKRDD
jgi:uncharacterized metal-binding protein YceD (DUF177 family)